MLQLNRQSNRFCSILTKKSPSLLFVYTCIHYVFICSDTLPTCNDIYGILHRRLSCPWLIKVFFFLFSVDHFSHYMACYAKIPKSPGCSRLVLMSPTTGWHFGHSNDECVWSRSQIYEALWSHPKPAFIHEENHAREDLKLWGLPLGTGKGRVNCLCRVGRWLRHCGLFGIHYRDFGRLAGNTKSLILHKICRIYSSLIRY